MRVTFYPRAVSSVYLPKPLVTPLWMWGPMGDVITHALFQLNRFRGYGATVTPNSSFPIHRLAIMTTVLYTVMLLLAYFSER